MKTRDIIGIHETSIILGLPEFLIRDFVSYEFNDKKLICADLRRGVGSGLRVSFGGQDAQFFRAGSVVQFFFER